MYKSVTHLLEVESIFVQLRQYCGYDGAIIGLDYLFFTH